MDKNRFFFHGKNFAESVEDYYNKREKAERKRKQYKYWIFTIGVFGIIYFLMGSIQIFQQKTFPTGDDVKEYVNLTKSNFFKIKICRDCFTQENEDNILGKRKIYNISTKENCKWNNHNATIETPDFPVAIIYKLTNDLVILDTVFNMMYHSKHFYCIIVDDKNISDDKRKSMMKMDQCLPNIFVTNKQDNIRGHSLECLNILTQFKWNYAVLLDENDIPIKNIKEISKDLKLLNGTSDVPIYSIFPKNISNFNQFTYGKIDIFKNKDIIFKNKHLGDKELTIARTVVPIILSRNDVDYYYNSIHGDNYRNFISLYSILRKNNVFWTTLLVNHELNFPTHITKSQSNISTSIGFSSFTKFKPEKKL